MTVRTGSQTDEATRLTLEILEEVFGESHAGNVGVRLWNGICWPEEGSYAATLVLKHPGALRAMFLPGTELGLGEAFIYDDFDVEGQIEAVFPLADGLAEATSDWQKKLRAGAALLRLPAGREHAAGRRGRADLSGKPHSIDRDRQAVTYHYDVSNDFYALFLDRNLVYSCAYFQSLEEELDGAQARKLDMICRKLRLKAGQRLLDVGCGWGGLVRHAADRYGVRADGITLSRPQADLANTRITADHLGERCRVEVQDYRLVDRAGEYDALASIGMFEHVGAAMLPKYFQKAYQLLKPGGVFLNHGIANRATEKPAKGPSFSDVYVFPDGELVPIHVTLKAAEETGFEVRDVESLREHYALTLRHWVRRLEANHIQALQYVDEPTYRVWRLFMSGSAHGFTSGRLNVYQTLLVKPGEKGQSGLPLTRDDWYSTA